MKNFTEWLNEAKAKIEVPGWTKISMKTFFSEMKQQSKCWTLFSEDVKDKPEHYGEFYLTKKMTKSEILSKINELKGKNVQPDTVKSTGSNYIRFTNSKRPTFFGQDGAKGVYKAKIGNGTVYLYHNMIESQSHSYEPEKIGGKTYFGHDLRTSEHEPMDEPYNHLFKFYYTED